MKFILGKKLEMTQIFDEKGNVTPVTLVEAGPCYVVSKKDNEKDGYESLQIGFEETKKIKKPQEGHLKKNGISKKLRYLKEFKNAEADLKQGEEIKVSIFKIGDFVKISGISKGKGYAGVIKRWNFNRKPTSHGAKHETRAQGSVGCRFPQRVVKGRKMSGRLGYERTTVKNLKVAAIDEKNNILAVKGAVPGRNGTLVEITG